MLALQLWTESVINVLSAVTCAKFRTSHLLVFSPGKFFRYANPNPRVSSVTTYNISPKSSSMEYLSHLFSKFPKKCLCNLRCFSLSLSIFVKKKINVIVLILKADPFVKFRGMIIQDESRCIPMFFFLSTQWMDA